MESDESKECETDNLKNIIPKTKQVTNGGDCTTTTPKNAGIEKNDRGY